jgi:DNA modification methylase
VSLYYEDDAVKIYHEDCLPALAKMESKSIDMIFSDPPYGLSYNNGDLASKREAVFGGNKAAMNPNPISNDGDEANFFLKLC